jgi:signal transduction histidine kinase
VGFVYLLLNQVIGKLSEEQQKVLETVYRNSEELLELIDNVLWMTSLSSGDTSPILEKFDAREIVNDAVKRHEKMIRDKGLQLNIQFADGDLSMVNDRAKVERVFQNIFNNAVKFTSAGEIAVKVSASMDRTQIDFEVIDTGVGIEQNKIDTIFEPFHQADNSAQRAFSGLGIGLTVARRMADLVGGKLSITSKSGSGTRVLMSFPAQAVLAAPVIVEQRRYG